MRLNPLLFCAAVALASGPLLMVSTAQAQQTRAEVKAERDQFLKDHVWDPTDSMWVRKDGTHEEMKNPTTRAKIKAERDAYLAAHRWDEPSERFVDVGEHQRVVSKLTPEQVRAETAEFLRTHRWDPANDKFVLRSGAKK
jgi:hypothetical protein